MVKTFKNLLLQNWKSYDLETWHVELNLTFLNFTAISNLGKLVSVLIVGPVYRTIGPLVAYLITKAQISCEVMVQLISTFVFAT